MVMIQNRYFVLLIFILLTNLNFAQVKFNFKFDTFTLKEWPGVHSFSYGEWKDTLWVFGGRVDGLHGKEEGFNYKNSNRNIYSLQVGQLSARQWDFKVMDPRILKILNSANSQYVQEGNKLYIMGGYGETYFGIYETLPYMMVIDLEALSMTLRTGNFIDSCITIWEDPIFTVTGGKLVKADSLFYLIGGHRVKGKYTSNSGLIDQQYTDRTLIFALNEHSGRVIQIQEFNDVFNFHRRDYNIHVQKEKGIQSDIILFSGVFQENIQSPFYNLSRINQNGIVEIAGFEQRLANYHCPHVLLANSNFQPNAEHHLFFGGMSEYFINSNAEVERDAQVPFVDHISSIKIDEDGNYSEIFFSDRLPGFFGAAAEFVHNKEYFNDSINGVDLSKLKDHDTAVIGWIIGGLWNPTNEPNPWVNERAQEVRSNPYILEVKLILSEGVQNHDLKENSSLFLSPNPVSDRIQITIPENILVYTNTLQIWSSSGTLLLAKAISKESQLELDLGFLAEGLYSVVILDRQGNKLVQRRITKLTKWR